MDHILREASRQPLASLQAVPFLVVLLVHEQATAYSPHACAARPHRRVRRRAPCRRSGGRASCTANHRLAQRVQLLAMRAHRRRIAAIIDGQDIVVGPGHVVGRLQAAPITFRTPAALTELLHGERFGIEQDHAVAGAAEEDGCKIWRATLVKSLFIQSHRAFRSPRPNRAAPRVGSGWATGRSGSGSWRRTRGSGAGNPRPIP